MAVCKVAERLYRKALRNNLLKFVHMKKTYNMKNHSFCTTDKGGEL